MSDFSESPADRRLKMLEKMAASAQADAFAGYALALEYRRRDRFDEALGAFEALKQRHPDYLPMYLMAGQMLIDRGQAEQARPWLEQGIELARRQGNGQALGELEAALEQTE